MCAAPVQINLPDADATADLGRTLGATLAAGDVILLAGPVGAGKTHLARSLIQSILSEPEDVPSPTFTLVQVYDTTRGPLWHADLYRLGSPDEVEELGLAEAFETAICLVEWPDRLASPPREALSVDIAYADDGRIATLSWDAGDWDTRLPVEARHA